MRFCFFLCIGALAALLTGCGGGSALKAARNNTSLQTGSVHSGTNAASRNSNGKATITIKWPARANGGVSNGRQSGHSRLIPAAANSIQVALANGSTPVASILLTRPDNNSALTSSYTFTELAPGTLTATAKAFPNADGTGTAQASAASTLTILDGQTAPLTLTMNSAVTSIALGGSPAANIDEITTLTATPLDANGNTVLVGGAITFSSALPTTATVDPVTGAVTGVGAGTTAITATYSEGGVPIQTGTQNVTITRGFLYIADYFNNRIQVMNSAGTYRSQFGSYGTGNGQFDGPLGVALDSNNNIYVVDQQNNRVQKFDVAGNYLSQFGTSGSGNGQFNNPTSLAIDSGDNIYVADCYNCRIQKFTSAGIYVSQFGSQGNGSGQFQSPVCIAIDRSNNIYVSDASLDRVQKFTSAGTYLTQFGGTGADNGQLSLPFTMAFDSNGNIYVVDEGNYRVEEFTSAGVYMNQFGSQGSGNGQFNNPYSIAIDGRDNIYVGDDQDCRVQKFTSAGAYLSQFGSMGSGNRQFQSPDALTIK